MSTSRCTPNDVLSSGLIVFFAVTLLLFSPPIATSPEGPAGARSDVPSFEPDPGWQEQMHRNLALAEYHVSMTNEGLQAPNRAHNLRTYFREGRLEVVPRDRNAADWLWTWKTAAC